MKMISPNRPKKFVTLFGAPGIGKSFILNSLLESHCFESKLHIERVTTGDVEANLMREKNGVCYQDTPSFPDREDFNPGSEADVVDQRFRRALLKDGLHVVCFVIELKNGRQLKVVDEAAITYVLKAFPDITEYCVIVKTNNHNETDYVNDHLDMYAQRLTRLGQTDACKGSMFVFAWEDDDNLIKDSEGKNGANARASRNS